MQRTKRPPRVKGRKLKAGERSLRFLRKEGYTAGVCEQFKPWVEGKCQQAIFKGGFRKDLFGFMDILAYRDHITLAVQTTSRMQITAHLRKYRSEVELRERILNWMSRAVFRSFVIHGWEPIEIPCTSKKTKAATRVVWDLTERWVTVQDLEV